LPQEPAFHDDCVIIGLLEVLGELRILLSSLASKTLTLKEPTTTEQQHHQPNPTQQSKSQNWELYNATDNISCEIHYIISTSYYYCECPQK
jgi:hypothetical protein